MIAGWEVAHTDVTGEVKFAVFNAHLRDFAYVCEYAEKHHGTIRTLVYLEAIQAEKKDAIQNTR